MKNTYCNRKLNCDIPNIDFYTRDSRMFTTEKSPKSYITTKKDLFTLLDYKKFDDSDFILFFDHRGNDVWNEKSMTLQKGTKFEFILIAKGFIKPLVVATTYAYPFDYSQVLIEKYEKWINEYLLLKTKSSN